MLHDAHIEVTCDGDRCRSSVHIGMDFVYSDYSGKNGYYDHEADKIEAKLIEECEWVVVPSEDEEEDNKHYCCAQCASPTVYV